MWRGHVRFRFGSVLALPQVWFGFRFCSRFGRYAAWFRAASTEPHTPPQQNRQGWELEYLTQLLHFSEVLWSSYIFKRHLLLRVPISVSTAILQNRRHARTETVQSREHRETLRLSHLLSVPAVSVARGHEVSDAAAFQKRS